MTSGRDLKEGRDRGTRPHRRLEGQGSKRREDGAWHVRGRRVQGRSAGCSSGADLGRVCAWRLPGCVTLGKSLSLSEPWFSCLLDEGSDSCPTCTHAHTSTPFLTVVPSALGCLGCSAKPVTERPSTPASPSPTGWSMLTAQPIPSSTTSSVVSGLGRRGDRGWQRCPGQQAANPQSRLNKGMAPAPSWGSS